MHSKVERVFRSSFIWTVRVVDISIGSRITETQFPPPHVVNGKKPKKTRLVRFATVYQTTQLCKLSFIAYNLTHLMQISLALEALM